ncbi:MAG: hypothetical protein KatS3mg008_1568 [Acidimicrobiales bacterium]|nr:MAG: hypothetical protein KatS3mg008_1568 [Acidimicrobiales bacterium]
MIERASTGPLLRAERLSGDVQAPERRKTGRQ